jgi:tRNA (guanosine-2'-O-)-methyltransferase
MNPERYARLRSVLRKRQPDLTVLMEQVHKPHNLSAILRNCDSVGILGAHAVPPPNGFAVSLHTSAGASKWVRVRRHDSTELAVAALHDEGFRVVAAHPTPHAKDFREIDYTAPTAVMVGSELDGLSARGIALADELISIPMMGMAKSLNVSVATALILSEARSQRMRAGLYEESRIPEERFETLLFEWAYPRLSRRYRQNGRPYPELTTEGALILPGSQSD